MRNNVWATGRDGERPTKRVRTGIHGKEKPAHVPVIDGNYTLDGPWREGDSGMTGRGVPAPLDSLQTVQHISGAVQPQEQTGYHDDSKFCLTRTEDVDDATHQINASCAFSKTLVSQQSQALTEQTSLNEHIPDEVCFGMVCMSFDVIQRVLITRPVCE